jgi:hypothetical protein
MDKKRHKEPCAPDACAHIVSERNRYFTGKYMTRRDFQADQDYFLNRRRLHNRLLHGWGVVCGLRVDYHPDRESDPDSDCARRWIVVYPGMALDCCGRELVLKKKVAFELPLPAMDKKGRLKKKTIAAGDDECHDLDQPFLVGLRYVEEKVEYVPTLFHEGECDPKREEANRVRECTELAVVCDPFQVRQCWQATGGDPQAHCRDDCEEDLPGPGGSCLEADCHCGNIVPLAIIYPTVDDDDGQVTGFWFEMEGRRQLPAPPSYLTHVVYHNWPHGGTVSLSELREDWGGKLRVRFDRKLDPADGYQNGVNPFTYEVEFGGVQQDKEYLPYSPDEPPGLEGDCWAVFTIDPSILRRKLSSLANNVIYVRLKCDFILDCHGNAVDGNHIGGHLPSGNGTRGGYFESWFRVVPDEDYEEVDKWQQQA